MEKLLTHNNYQILRSGNIYNLISINRTPTLSKIFIGSASDEMYYSLDGGYTWSQIDVGTDNWTYLAYTYFSGDGQTILVIGYNSSSAAYWSTDGGESWDKITSAGSQDRQAALSEDGTYVIFNGWNPSDTGRITKNHGNSWADVSSEYSTTFWNAMSSDGHYMYIGNGDSSTTNKWQKSSDYGDSFTIKGETMNSNIFQLNCDDSGQYVMFHYGANDLNVWLSSDYGESASQLSTYDGNAYVSNDANYMIYNEEAVNKIFTSTNQGTSWNNFTTPIASGLDVHIKLAKTQNRGFFFGANNSIIYEVDAGGTSYTLIKDFGAGVIRDFECGDNEMVIILTDKTVYKANYDDVTDWTQIYTFPGATASTYISIK